MQHLHLLDYIFIALNDKGEVVVVDILFNEIYLRLSHFICAEPDHADFRNTR